MNTARLRTTPILDEKMLRERAIDVMKRNDLGSMTTAAPDLYPHMWSWDAAFVTIGLARITVARAIVELQTLLAAQWSTGMIPHIVFADEAAQYFPGADRWGTQAASAKPAGAKTSGICQPPVHAIALKHILERGRENGGDDQVRAEAFARDAFDGLLAWHRWLATVRDPDSSGLIEIHHGWESGFDNSPRWDGPYARITPGEIEPFERRDTLHVADPSERPSDAEYTRYLWLVKQMADARFDDALIEATIDFRVKDVFFSAIMAAASEVLANIGREIGRPDAATELDSYAARFRHGVEATIDPRTGLARDFDVLASEWIATDTISGFAPLIAGTTATRRAELRAVLLGADWMGHPTLLYRLPPSTSPSSPAYRPRTYWRGPVWPFLCLLFGWAADRDGDTELAGVLRSESLDQLSDLEFGEYYEPVTGEPLGSHWQAWTAAAALEWLGQSHS